MNKGFLKSLPISISKNEIGIILQRGNSKFLISGRNAYTLTKKILDKTIKPILVEDLINSFTKKIQTNVHYLLKELINRKIIYHYQSKFELEKYFDSAEDIFYWHFSELNYKKILNNKRILIIGYNFLNHHLVNALKSSGYKKISLILDKELDNNIPEAPNVKIITQDTVIQKQTASFFDLVIAASDLANIQRLNFWNEVCLKKNLNYLPICLNNTRSEIGPLIIPKLTSCYNCYILRVNSNSHSFNHIQINTKTNGFHQIMPLITANIAAMELAKFFLKPSTSQIGNLIEYDFIQPFIHNRKILKTPYCTMCCQHDPQ